MSYDSAWANSRNGWTSVLRRPDAMWIPPKPTVDSEDESNEDHERSESDEDDDEYEDDDDDKDKEKTESPQEKPTDFEEPFPPPPSQYPPGVRSWRMNAELSVPWPDINMAEVEEYAEDPEDEEDEEDEVESAHESEDKDEFQSGDESESLSEGGSVKSEPESDDDTEDGKGTVDGRPQNELQNAVNSPIDGKTSETANRPKRRRDTTVIVVQGDDIANNHKALLGLSLPRTTISGTSDGSKEKERPARSLVNEAAFGKVPFPPPPSQYPPGVRSWRMNAGPYVVLPKDQDWARPERVAARCNDRALYKRSVRARINSELDSRKAEPVLQVGGGIQQSSAPTCTESHDNPGISPVGAAPVPDKAQGSLFPPVAKEKEGSAGDVSPHDLSVNVPVIDRPDEIKSKNARFLRLYFRLSNHLDAKDHLHRKITINEGYATQPRLAEDGSETGYFEFHKRNIVHPAVELRGPCASTRYNGLRNEALLSEVEENVPLWASRRPLPAFDDQNNITPRAREKRKVETMDDGHENTEGEPATKRTATVATVSAPGNPFHSAIIIDEDTDDHVAPIRAAQTSFNPVAQQTQDVSTLVTPPPPPRVVSPRIHSLEQKRKFRAMFRRIVVNNRARSNWLPAAPASSGYVLVDPGAYAVEPSQGNTASIESIELD